MTELTMERRRDLVAAANGPGSRPLVGGVRVLTPQPTAAARPPVQTAPASPVPVDQVDVVEQLLAAGDASARQRTRTLAARVRQLLTELQGRLDSEAAEQEVEARIEQLRTELAAAESRLRTVRRGGPELTSTTSTSSTPQTRATNRAAREWAIAQGIEVKPRGKVSNEVMAQWQAATGQGQ
ncbi:Lsr2 family DNA-binding protein [Micromonospora aurantiaca (nom. illeg.)]